MVRQLGSCTWIAEHLNVLITGSTGVGKSYLASALGQAACRKGMRVMYRRVPRLFDELALARVDGSYARVLARLARAEVLVLDYKTNRPPPATEDEVAEIYLRQMSAYRAALRRIYADRRISCALLWTDGPRLMPLSSWLLDRYSP